MNTLNTLWASGRDEEVQVNQRALIDKVLARYSGEHTVLRELLQNSDDAGAKTAEIHFNTRTFLERRSSANPRAPNNSPLAVPPSPTSKLPDLTKETLHQWEFRNDGSPFRDEDWNRLKKIADGNPDIEKIGAFGVGFYSLFSVTDEPFVTSGEQWMGFYWKDNKDQLFARRGTVGAVGPIAADEKKWTTFTMPLREAGPFPSRPVDIARFLATSLTFMVNLCDVSMFFNEHLLVRIRKNTERSKPLTLPLSSVPLDPKARIADTMIVEEVISSDLRMQVQILRWIATVEPKPSTTSRLLGSLIPSWRSPSTDPLEALNTLAYLTRYSARVESRLDQKSIAELERATKKKPPTTCWYSLVYTGKDEFDMSRAEDPQGNKAPRSVFQGLHADLDGAGTARVFIGHATSQTTGIGGHISARFIPTVERESIDLVDRRVSVWNKELLWVGGYLCRFIYESQLAPIRTAWDEAGNSRTAPGAEISARTRKLLESKALHILKFFTFHPTTPSPVVGLSMEEAFFACARDTNAFPILSSTGIKPVSKVRSYSPECLAFLKTTPLITEAVAKAVPLTIIALQKQGLIRDITFEEVLQELKQRTLNETEMVACLKWRIGLDTADLDQEMIKMQFLGATTFSCMERKEDGGTEERIISLASIKSFLSRSNEISPNFPLPPYVLPFSLSNQFEPEPLRDLFDWADLTVVEWLEYLLLPSNGLPVENNITQSPEFAEAVLQVLAEAWVSLSTQQRQRIVKILRTKTVIPTKSGLKIPKGAYFKNPNVFRDLPIVELPKSTPISYSLREVLTDLGVRQHVDLQLLFDRMITTEEWSVRDLVEYLVAVKDQLTPFERNYLRQASAFPQEVSTPGSEKPARTKLKELYEPKSDLRELGLPLLDWGIRIKWRPESEEGEMLFGLGLKKFPPLTTILELASKAEDPTRQKKAFRYLLDSFDTHYARGFEPDQVAHLAFIPSLTPDGTPFSATLREVFTNPECGFLGFPLVESNFRDTATRKLGVLKDPPTALLMPIFQDKPFNDHDTARKMFEYSTTRIADFSPEQFQVLRALKIVPAIPLTVRSDSNKKQGADKWVLCKPEECFFRGDGGRSSSDVHSRVFTFVDFGSKANRFLEACGVKDEPSMHEVAQAMVRDPKQFLELAGGYTEYADELRQVAANSSFDAKLLAQMRVAPFLIASRRQPVKGSQVPQLVNIGDGQEDDYDVVFELLCPSEIVIIDDTNAYSLFAESLWVSPEDDTLEAFYQSLGCRRLTSVVSESSDLEEVEATASRKTEELRNLVLQRFPIFIHDRITQCKVNADWLAQDSNFVVKGCRKLNLVRKLEFGGKIVEKTQGTSAAAELGGPFGPLTLFYSQEDELDMHEVAHSICRLLMKNPKVNDSLLFTTIISTDLRALRRRGFNINRILHQQKVERVLQAAPEDNPFANPPPEETVLSTSRMERNVRRAIDASTSENNSILPNGSSIIRMQWSPEGDYCCYMSKTDKDFTSTGILHGYKLYVAQDVTNPLSDAGSKGTALSRFASAIITPLKDVYKLPPNSVHILYDQDSQLIAFNRNGCLFVNFGYYESRHDCDVRSGDTAKVLISWYHYLAHLIAHNLVQLHNSEHEFYFSAICESHLLEALRLANRPFWLRPFSWKFRA